MNLSFSFTSWSSLFTRCLFQSPSFFFSPILTCLMECCTKTLDLFHMCSWERAHRKCLGEKKKEEFNKSKQANWIPLLSFKPTGNSAIGANRCSSCQRAMRSRDALQCFTKLSPQSVNSREKKTLNDIYCPSNKFYTSDKTALFLASTLQPPLCTRLHSLPVFVTVHNTFQ